MENRVAESHHVILKEIKHLSIARKHEIASCEKQR